MKQKVLDALYNGKDPMDHFQVNPNDIDLQGWNSDHDYLKEAILEFRPRVIVETGVWKGGSTMAMARILKENDIKGCIISIDTFLGCHLLWRVQQWQPSLRRVHGRPTYWKTFYANVISQGLQDYVVPVHLDTASGFRLLRNSNITTPLIHHDASHQAPDVFTDLCLAWDILQKGGHLIVDDYLDTKAPPGDPQDFRGLMKNVNEFAEAVHVSVEAKNPKARLIK
jgi:predicted O-methyltransferase YrrM